jgi:hypothetical protein
MRGQISRAFARTNDRAQKDEKLSRSGQILQEYIVFDWGVRHAGKQEPKTGDDANGSLYDDGRAEKLHPQASFLHLHPGSTRKTQGRFLRADLQGGVRDECEEFAPTRDRLTLIEYAYAHRANGLRDFF